MTEFENKEVVDAAIAVLQATGGHPELTLGPVTNWWRNKGSGLHIRN